MTRGVLCLAMLLAPLGVGRASTGSGGDPSAATGLVRTGRVVVTQSSIVILQPIAFRPGSARVEAESREMIEAIANTLQAFSDLGLEISGQAQARERHAHRLALRRATAIREAILAHGVPPERVTVGRPDPRAKQRGVELVVTHPGD